MRAGRRRTARREKDKGAEPHRLGALLRVDTVDAQAWRGAQVVKLTPKAFAVLQYLSEHAECLVSKDELLRVVWADTVVTDGTLVACIRELRKALGDDAQTPQYIETVHRRGYRFIGSVVSPQHSG